MTAERLHGLDVESLSGYLAGPLELEGDLPLEVELMAGGRSNITCLLRTGDRSWVLRRPPLGHRQPTAHNMRREFEVLEGLVQSDVPAPRPILLCEDPDLIGSIFYVMERAIGRIVRTPADLDISAAEARRCSLALVETLALIHTTSYEAIGLEGLGNPDGYVERQVQRWIGQLESGIRVTPEIRDLADRLARSVPERSAASLVHGDYRIDNVVLGTDDPGEAVAVLDWEMATLGDPLADLGMLLMYWRRPGERLASDVHEITAAEGFLERDEVVATYARATGFDLEYLDFFMVLAHFKLAVIVEGIHARHQAGETVGKGFEQVAEIPGSLVETAIEIADKSGVPGLRRV